MVSNTIAPAASCSSIAIVENASDAVHGLRSEPTASCAGTEPSAPAAGPGFLHPNFIRSLDSLQAKFEQLTRMQPCRYPNLPKTMPKQGIYLFSEQERYWYVGRSSNIRTSYGRHCNPNGSPRTADFAFKLASISAGRATMFGNVSENTKKLLMKDSKFRAAFDSAKKRIRTMDFRFVEQSDQNSQALLAAYCTLALDVKYNDLDAH